MKSVKNKLLFTLIAVLCISFVCAFTCFFVNKVDNTANAQNFSYTGTLKQKYNLNQTVTIPTAKLNGVDATYRVILPNGSYTNSEAFELTLPGFYAIEYTAVVDGVLYTDTKSFLVNGNLFTLDGAGSYEYVSYDTQYGEKSGLLFNVKSGDSIVYNDVVDLNAINGPRSTIYRMSMNSEKPGDAEITRYEVVLTDAYDPNKYVTVRVKQSPGNDSNKYSIAYWDASFNDTGIFFGFSNRSASGKYQINGLQGISGDLDGDGTEEPIIDAKYNGYTNEERWGAACMHSFTGGTSSSPQNDGSWWGGVAYDVNTNIIYGYTGKGLNSIMYRVPIADLDNADIYGEKFGGFTDGKVKVTIKPTSFSKGSANLFITQMGDNQITEKNSQEFLSPYAPEINVDFGEYSSSSVPQVKKGNRYNVFPATAYDIFDGNIPVDVKVYYGYYSDKRVQCDLSNGSFLANRLGTYTIVYSTVNSNGKTDTEIVDVQSVAVSDKLNIIVENEFDYSTPILAGTPVKVFDGFSFVNQTSTVEYSFVATHKTQPNISFDLTLDNDYTFIPTVKGEYNVVYTVSDYSETQVVSKTLTVNESNNIHYVLDGNFTQYLIKNGNYLIDFIKAYTLDTGVPVEQKVDLFVQNGSNLLPISDYILCVTDGTEGSINYINDSNMVKLVAYPNIAGITPDKYFVREIPVIDTGLNTLDQLDMTKYFIEEKGDITLTAQEFGGIDVAIDNFDNGAVQFSWLNTISAKPFKLEVEPSAKGEEFVRFDEMNVYLYDFNDSEKFVKISFYYTDAWYTTINEGKSYKVGNVWGSADDQFVIDFNALSKTLKINRAFTWSNLTYFGLNDAVDYSNGCVMGIEIKGQDGCDGIRLVSINSTSLSNVEVDLAPYYIETAHDNNAGEKSLNDVITLPIYKSFDLLTPYNETRVTVEVKPDGEKKYSKVTSLDGVLLDGVLSNKEYQFKTEKFGSYRITISVDDYLNDNNVNSFNYQIIVVDNIKPEVVITSASTTASVGNNLSLPKFSVSNKDDYNWYVTVKQPNNDMYYVDANKPFKFTQKGKHTVTLVVYDVNWNTTRVTYTVVVK